MSESVLEGRKEIIISILQLRKQKKEEALQHVYLHGEGTGGFMEKNLLLALQLALSPEQLDFAGAE